MLFDHGQSIPVVQETASGINWTTDALKSNPWDSKSYSNWRNAYATASSRLICLPISLAAA
jgi:hypothetical protein